MQLYVIVCTAALFYAYVCWKLKSFTPHIDLIYEQDAQKMRAKNYTIFIKLPESIYQENEHKE